MPPEQGGRKTLFIFLKREKLKKHNKASYRTGQSNAVFGGRILP